MTVKSALNKINARDGLLVMYRMMVPIINEEHIYESDELIGFCRYTDGKLVPEDGDSYDMNDKIDKYEYVHNQKEEYLIVWECKADMTIPIAEPWFSMILSREKKEEYREIKDYLYQRFRKVFPFVKNTAIPLERNWDRRWIRFVNGYGKDRPSFLAECSLRLDTGNPKWGAEEGKEYYVLTIHKAYAEKSGTTN